MTIPASQIVQVNPGVISAGGSALALNGVILTENTSVPIGTAMPFVDATSVSDYFGATSAEYKLAAAYFGGFDNKTQTPGQLFFWQYNATAVAGYLRSGSLAAMTLAELQALSGTISLTVGGVAENSTTINLSAATSFSDAATIIQAGFTTPPFTVSYDSQLSAFVFTTTATGAAATITVATGTLSASLYLTTATGAILSQGADATTQTASMNALMQQTLNWGGFMTAWEPTQASDKVAFAAWANSQNNRFYYINRESSAAAKTYPDTTTATASIIVQGYSGTCSVYCDATLDPDGLAAAMVLGSAAAIDFSRTNGRITFAFKYQSGIAASVTDSTMANDLELNGYNFIGSYATANDSFTFFYPGTVSGKYDYLDEFVNQVYLNSQLQLAMMTLLTGANSIPYNNDGYALIHAAAMDPINQALNFGSIRQGVSLSTLQAAEVNNAAGVQIDKTLSTRGWYLQINDATAQVRAARGSPPTTLWYMDGGSVQKITLASILVQ